MKQNMIKNMSAVFCLGILLCIRTTTAYFSDCDQLVNVLEAGHNTTEIEENFPDPTPKPLDENPEFEKTVWGSNDSTGENGKSVPCYVRLCLSYSDFDIAKALTYLNLNTSDWIYNEKDDYYYYRHILGKGKKTAPLFTGFRIDSSKVGDNCKDKISDFRIHVYEESIQAEGFSDYTAAWNYYLHPVHKA